MIVIDTSALVSILWQESDAELMLNAIHASPRRCMGAPTKFELNLVMGGWRKAAAMAEASQLLFALRIEIADWTNELADIAGQAFLRFGKGQHKAALNFGDCMAYALAKSLDAPLLYKGSDFSMTDIRSAL